MSCLPNTVLRVDVHHRQRELNPRWLSKCELSPGEQGQGEPGVEIRGPKAVV